MGSKSMPTQRGMPNILIFTDLLIYLPLRQIVLSIFPPKLGVKILFFSPRISGMYASVGLITV